MRTFFSLTLQVSIDVLEVFSVAEEVFQYRLQHPGVSLEKKFGEAVQRAYQHWVDFLPDQKDVLREIKEMRKEKQWKNEFEFNIFIAKKMLLSLSGGKCLINSDHEPALTTSRKHGKREVPLLLPHEFGWKGLGMGKKKFAIIELYNNFPWIPF